MQEFRLLLVEPENPSAETDGLLWYENGRPMFNVKLQVRNILSDEAKLGIQSSEEAQVASAHEAWHDVPVVMELKSNACSLNQHGRASR